MTELPPKFLHIDVLVPDELHTRIATARMYGFRFAVDARPHGDLIVGTVKAASADDELVAAVAKHGIPQRAPPDFEKFTHGSTLLDVMQQLVVIAEDFLPSEGDAYALSAEVLETIAQTTDAGTPEQRRTLLERIEAKHF